MLALVIAGCATLLAGGEAQLERVWQASQIWLPDRAVAGSPAAPGGGRLATLAAILERIPPGTRVPAVLYAHDCGGPGAEAAAWGERLSRAGYAVIAPDSRARSDGVTDRCPSGTTALATREAEIRYALRQLRTLSWVRQRAVFLLAVGEGAAAAARDDGLELTGWISLGEAIPPRRIAHSLTLERTTPAGLPSEDEQRAVVEFLRRLTLP